MNQKSLFDQPKTITRTIHPETSRAAAKRLIESGRFSGDEKRALTMVRQNPGMTGPELDRLAGVENRQVSKRLGGLANKGVIVRCEPRECTARNNGNRFTTWKAV